MPQPPQNLPPTTFSQRLRRWLGNNSKSVALFRRWLPPAIGVAAVGLFLKTTDLQQVLAAIRQADLLAFTVVVLTVSLITWIYDSFCLAWLIRVTLGARGTQEPIRMRQLLPLKAASYVLNLANYHAAALGMAVLVGRRKKVPFLEAAGALAVLSYLDLVAVATMTVVGLLLAPDVLGGNAALQRGVQFLVAGVFAAALTCLTLLQSNWQLPILLRLRNLSPLKPLVALRPKSMAIGILLRMGLILMYTLSAVEIMRSFGMKPDFARMFVAMPIITIIGALPLSFSGVGTTQIAARWLYAPFVVDGRLPSPVIDSYTTAQIFGYVFVRLLIAAPFLRAINAELRGEQTPSAPEKTAPDL